MELDLTPTACLRIGRAALRREDAGVADPDDISLRHADRRQPEHDAARRLHVHPELSLQLYTQLFLARVSYAPYYTSDRRRRARAHRRPGRAHRAGQPNTERATLNINLVMRWEYRLGSTLFVVYTRAQNPALSPSPDGATSGSPHPGRPRRRQRAMVKLAYWFG